MVRAGSLIRDGADASALVIKRVLRIDVAKAIDPLSPTGFVRITEAFARELSSVSGPLEDAALKRAMHKLDVDWTKLSPAQRSAAVRAANTALRPLEQRVPPAVEVKFESHADRVIDGTRKSVKRRFARSISASMTMRDERVAAKLVRSQSAYIRDEYGRRRDHFSQKAREIVASGLESGLDRYDIAEDLAIGLGAVGVNRSDAYWQVVSNAFTNTARSFTTLNAFDEAEIERYEWSSVNDERTTDFCRMMDGRIFSTGKALGKLGLIDASSDPEAIQVVTPWVNAGVDDDGQSVLFFNRGDERVKVAQVDESAVGARDQVGSYSKVMSNNDLEDNGLTIPPAHALCRSVLIAV